MQDKPVNADVDAASLAKRTAGFSGAELSNLVNEAALAAGKGGLPQITSALLDDAQDKVLMGSERRSATASSSHTSRMQGFAGSSRDEAGCHDSPYASWSDCLRAACQEHLRG